MNAFALDWLQCRAPFDEAARSSDLARRFAAALENAPAAPRRILELAAGSGAGFMALAPVVAVDQEWVSIDQDSSLLTAQSAAISRWAECKGWRCRRSDTALSVETPSGRWLVRPEKLDLAASLEHVDLSACHGITTSAFLDLVSAAWLDRLCGMLTARPLPLLAALTVDGQRLWHPPLPGDRRVHAAFMQHQSRDKGFGPALGGTASGYLARALAARGYEVRTARSDWRIGCEQREMLSRLVADAAAIACDTMPAAATEVADWRAERIAQVATRRLTMLVGHVDLLALPPA
jgi:hypothetical protein